jgi:hypothetical protein
MSMTMLDMKMVPRVDTTGDPMVITPPILDPGRLVTPAPPTMQATAVTRQSVPFSVRTEVRPPGIIWVVNEDWLALKTIIDTMTLLVHSSASADAWLLDVGFVANQPPPPPPVDSSWYYQALGEGYVVLVKTNTIGTANMVFEATKRPATVAGAQGSSPWAVVASGSDDVMMQAEALLRQESPPPAPETCAPGLTWDPWRNMCFAAAKCAENTTLHVATNRCVPTTGDSDMTAAEASTGLPSWVLPVAAVAVVGLAGAYYLHTTGRLG